MDRSHRMRIRPPALSGSHRVPQFAALLLVLLVVSDVRGVRADGADGPCSASCEADGRRVLLFGSRNCAFTPGARKVAQDVDAAGFLQGFGLCLVDMDDDDGRALALDRGIRASPVMLFEDGGTELWRAVAPGDADELIRLARDVADGARTWDAQRRRLAEGQLDGPDCLELARAAVEAGDTTLQRDALRGLLALPTTTPSEREEASRALAIAAGTSVALDEHIAAFPGDIAARTRRARYWLREPTLSVETLVKEIDEIILLMRAREHAMPTPFVTSVYKLAYDVVDMGRPDLACWALPHVERCAVLEPKEGWHLQRLVALLQLCPSAADRQRFVEQFRRAYDEDAMAPDRRARFGGFVAGLVTDGEADADAIRRKSVAIAAPPGVQTGTP